MVNSIIGNINTANMESSYFQKENITPHSYKYLYRGLCSAILIATATVSFFYVWYEFVKVENTTGSLTGSGNLLMSTIIYAILFFIIGRGLHAFRIGAERITSSVISQVLTAFSVDYIEILVSMAVTGQWRFINRFFVIYSRLFLFQAFVLGIMVVPMIHIYKALFPPIDIIEIYGQKNGLYNKLNRLDDKYHISEEIYGGDVEIDTLVDRIREHEAVLINDLPSNQKNLVLKTCFDMDKRVYVVPKISDVIIRYSDELNIIDTPLFLCRNNEITLLQRIIKRIMDLVLSLVALIVLSPVMLITAAAIKKEDGGPVLFTQKRATKGGKEFTIYKFRSMKVGGDSLTPTGNDDDRITKVGKIIRPWRIDEIPQLINIINGDMSIVGPRPERIEHTRKYSDLIPEFSFRNKMKGGLTGYAQVYGRYNTSALDKLKLDLIYITNYSIVTDIQIIFETVKILFLKESTEGFDTDSLSQKDLEEVRKESD